MTTITFSDWAIMDILRTIVLPHGSRLSKIRQELERLCYVWYRRNRDDLDLSAVEGGIQAIMGKLTA